MSSDPADQFILIVSLAIIAGLALAIWNLKRKG